MNMYNNGRVYFESGNVHRTLTEGWETWKIVFIIRPAMTVSFFEFQEFVDKRFITSNALSVSSRVHRYLNRIVGGYYRLNRYVPVIQYEAMSVVKYLKFKRANGHGRPSGRSERATDGPIKYTSRCRFRESDVADGTGCFELERVRRSIREF